MISYRLPSSGISSKSADVNFTEVTILISCFSAYLSRPGTAMRRAQIVPASGLLNVVQLDRFVLKILIKPIQDMLQPFDAMPRRAGPRKLVRFVGEAHHRRRNLAILQSAKHDFTAVRRRRAIVGLSFDEHHRSSNVLHICER